ncbi:RrF2 family transcriptional regulator [Candidatus Caldatribacterium sp.]|uniref:RrF2 family transcriptional regulator n=1 Tax=Candidatus Caldatribacterium sp. TaxID=2282143 RepID=UPI003843B67E|nr:Rrf2 family transcriptional regulator [Candidatus Caldatribacterium sp.]
MKISTRLRCGLRLLARLAQAFGKGTPLKARDVAEAEHLSPDYLRQIAAMLEAQGIVQSIRGKDGGYILAKPPEEVTLLEVVQALEGPIHPVECLVNPSFCSFVTSCSTKKIWEDTAACLTGFFATKTLKNLVEEERG